MTQPKASDTRIPSMRSLFRMLLVLLALDQLPPMAANAQELIPNGGFEVYTACPTMNSRINDAPPWFNAFTAVPYGPGPTPDLLNSCADGGQADVPVSAYGNLPPVEGEGYAGLVVRMGFSPDFREYMEVPLAEPLVAGVCYRLSLHLSLAGTFSTCTVGGIGAHFAPDPVVQTVQDTLPIVPQLDGLGAFIPENGVWTHVMALYPAEGGERYLVLGNFHDDAHTAVLDLDSTTFALDAYYFVDSVSLVAVPAGCGPLSIPRSTTEIHFAHPNPATDEVYMPDHPTAPYRIINSLGAVMQQGRPLTGIIDVSGLPTGAHVLELHLENPRLRMVLIKE